jgi:hypothetical protein
VDPISGVASYTAGVASDRVQRYLGLVDPQGQRSSSTRITKPGRDSSAWELRVGLALGLLLALVFVVAIATQSWPWKVLGGLVVLLVAVPQCVRSLRLIRL